jgi:hypothetical protein
LLSAAASEDRFQICPQNEGGVVVAVVAVVAAAAAAVELAMTMEYLSLSSAFQDPLTMTL